MKAKREKEVKMFAILKEIAAYMMYLVIITVLVYDNVDPNAFATNNHIKEMFVKKFEKVCLVFTCNAITQIRKKRHLQFVVNNLL